MLRKSLWLLLTALCCAAGARAAGDTLLSVFFRSGESILTDGIKRQIDDAIYLGTISDRDAFQLIGYADEVGGAEENVRLSKARATVVKTYLVQSGFHAERITLILAKGKAEARSTADGSGYPRDRRVEVVKTAAPPLKAPPPPPMKAAKSVAIDVSHVAAGESIRINNIYFQPGRHYFLSQSDTSLNELFQSLYAHPKVRIRIEGHVCCTYGEDDGLDEDTNLYNLSETRAQAVKGYLIRKGIAADRLEAVGMARHKPIYPTEHTEAEMQANRRVEIRVL